MTTSTVRQTPSRSLVWAAPVLLFVWGMVLCMYYGRIGVFPISYSILFDGGWRMMQGQIPFRDFVAPNGFVPMLMQVPFFAILGVNWFAYALHAAILNGLFVVLAFVFSRQIGIAWKPALLLAALTAVVYYTPSGLPYMEQHAFFFILLALVCIERGRTGEVLWSCLAGICIVLAYLSKQIPTLALIPFVLLYQYQRVPKEKWKPVTITVIAALVLIALIILAGFALGMHWSLVRTYYFEIPNAEGVTRVTRLFTRTRTQELLHLLEANRWLLAAAWGVWIAVAILLRDKLRLGWLQVLFYPFAVAIGLLCFYAWSTITPLLVLVLATYVVANAGFEASAVLATGLTVMCLLFTALSWNEPENCAPYIFLCVALVLSSLETRKHIGRPWIKRTLFAAAVIDAIAFHFSYNTTRSVHHISPDLREQQAATSNALPTELDWLEWGIWKNYQFSAADVSDVTSFLRRDDAVFWLFGDMSMLYGITQKPSVQPTLWYHFGLTVPVPGTREFIEFQEWTLKNIEQNHAKYVVLEGDHTMAGCTLSEFPLLDAFVRDHTAEEQRFGGFRVRKILR